MIYLDNQATTRCDPRVVAKMLPYFSEHYGNAASKTHSFGWMAEAAVDMAREEVAVSIGANTNEIIFCSGATEANHLALQGGTRASKKHRKQVVVAATEHLSVLDCAKALEKEGCELVVLPVQSSGLVDPGKLLAALNDNTTLVSVMLVNNEIGVVQDVARLAKVVHEFRSDIVFHCDAAQGLGKIEIDVRALGVDLLSLSAHKVYGPKGIGALWTRRRPYLGLAPLLHGGGQERGIRPGTVAVPLVVGFGVAATLAVSCMAEEAPRIQELRDRLLIGLQAQLGGIEVNGHKTKRVGGNLNISIAGISSDALVIALGSLACSTGSACSSGNAKNSHVLEALGQTCTLSNSLRFGIGRFTTDKEIDEAIAMLVAAIKPLRKTLNL